VNVWPEAVAGGKHFQLSRAGFRRTLVVWMAGTEALAVGNPRILSNNGFSHRRNAKLNHLE